MSFGTKPKFKVCRMTSDREAQSWLAGARFPVPSPVLHQVLAALGLLKPQMQVGFVVPCIITLGIGALT